MFDQKRCAVWDRAEKSQAQPEPSPGESVASVWFEPGPQRKALAVDIDHAFRAEESARASAEKDRDYWKEEAKAYMNRAIPAEAEVAEITRQREDLQADMARMQAAHAATLDRLETDYKRCWRKERAESSLLAQKARETERGRLASILWARAADYRRACVAEVERGGCREGHPLQFKAKEAEECAAIVWADVRALPSAPATPGPETHHEWCKAPERGDGACTCDLVPETPETEAPISKDLACARCGSWCVVRIDEEQVKCICGWVTDAYEAMKARDASNAR